MAGVLVVDDEPIVCEVVVCCLEREGHTALEADHGDCARELLEQQTPDLVGHELGADDYVTKPFSPCELSARVRTVLRRATYTEGAHAHFAFGDLEIDTQTREVHVDGAELWLGIVHMGDDVKILVVSAASATVAMIGGLDLTRSIAGSIDRVRDASIALSHGGLTVQAPESGPAEVAILASSFDEMAVNIEQLFDARRKLVAWASHDLRTPLANMQAMLEVPEVPEDRLAEPDDYLPALGDQVRSLTLLVDDLFGPARIDVDAPTLELRDTSLEDVVSSRWRGVAAA